MPEPGSIGPLTDRVLVELAGEQQQGPIRRAAFRRVVEGLCRRLRVELPDAPDEIDQAVAGWLTDLARSSRTATKLRIPFAEALALVPDELDRLGEALDEPDPDRPEETP